MTDAYAANLSAQSYTFIGNGSTPLGVLSQQSFSVKVTGLRGAEAVAAAVDISALTLPTGLTVTSDNHLTAPTLTFTATTSLTVTTLAAVGNMVTLPVVLDGGKVTLNRAISLQIAPTGIGVDELVTQYYLSTSDSTQTDGSWSATPAAYVAGRYYWKRDKVDWTDGTTSYTDPVLDNALTNANANALQAGQPNISPFYARVPYAVGDYWMGWSGTLNNPLKLTPLSDGWVHVEYDNRSGSDISRCDEQMIRSDMVKEGADYTFLFEVRNNTSTGTSDFYIVQTDNCQFWGSGIKKNLEGNKATSNSITFADSNVGRDGTVYYKRFVKTSEATGSSHWTGSVNRLCSLTFRAQAGAYMKFDIRVSMYEGEYWGPYKPYVDYGLREEVENLEVGGRNLLLGTGEPVEKTIALNASNYMTIDTYQTVAPVPNLFEEGDYLTISFDWETTATSGYFRVECGTVTPYVWGQVVKATGGRSPNTQYVDFASDNTSGHFEIVYKVTSAVASATSSLKWLRIRIDGAATSGKTFKISNAKVERGKNASDWTPAPEDIDADISDLREELETQIDAKIETWTQDTNPATAWTSAEQAAHDGDLWYYTGTSTLTIGGVSILPSCTYQYDGEQGTWSRYDAQTTSLFDFADGKSTIYYGTPSGTYANKEVGDYLVDSTDGSTYRWSGSAWVKVTDYQTAVDAIEIGGRNLLLDTATPSTSPGSSGGASSGSTYTRYYYESDPYGVSLLHSNTDDLFTISFDYVVTGTLNSNTFIYPQVNGAVIRPIDSGATITITDSNRTGHYCRTFKCTAEQIADANTGARVTMQYAGDGATVSVKNLKLECGNKETDWTPAPEDIDADIAAVETIANGKNKVYYAVSEPAGGTYIEGDTWFQIDSGGEVIAIKNYNGTTWVDRPLDKDALDVFSVASAVIGYLDVYSLTAAQVAALFGAFKGIRSFATDEDDDPVSYWDLETGKFHTVDGEFTGDIKGSNVTGSKFRTTADHLSVIESTPDAGSFDDTGTYTSGDAYIEVDAGGMYSIPVSSPTTKRSQLRQARFKIISGGATNYFWGWYASPMLAAERIFMNTGEAISGYKVLELINTVSSPATGVTGVTGVVWGRFAMLFFNSFSYDPSVISLTAYTLNAAYIPELRQDLKDTLNDVRFYIYCAADNSSTTPAGCIKPATTLTTTKAFRGTFTYIRANNMT